MARIERDEQKKLIQSDPQTAVEAESYLAKIRISVRVTTASFADYDDWNIEGYRFASLVTDGSCS